MKTAILMEFRKFFSTRMWWVLLIAMTGYMAFLAGIMGLSSTITVAGQPAQDLGDPLETARGIYTIATAMGYIFPALVGALSVTSEFRHKTITPTLLAVPNRTRLIGAKMIGSIPVGLAFGVAGTLAGLVAGALALEFLGDGAMLHDPLVWKSVGLSVVALTLWTVVGVGLGAMLTNQVAVILVLLAFTQFVEPILRMLLTAAFEGKFAAVGQYLPGAAGESITGGSIYSTLGAGDLLPAWIGALTLVGYGLVAALIGRITSFRRDFT